MTECAEVSPPAVAPRAGNGYDAMLLAKARTLVERTTRSQFAIAEELGVPQSTVSSWKRREGWVRPPDAPRALGIQGPGQDRRARRGARLLGRLYRAFSHELTALEGRRGTDAESFEKNARALASLAKTLETLMALDRDDGAKRPDPEAVDPDEIRAKLARRLYSLGQSGE